MEFLLKLNYSVSCGPSAAPAPTGTGYFMIFLIVTNSITCITEPDLIFVLKVKGKHIFQVFLKGAIHWRLWPFTFVFLKVFPMTVYSYLLLSPNGHTLERKTKVIEICLTRTSWSCSQVTWSEIQKSETLKCNCLRTGFV